ncbi:MAG: methylated-DNA--[protein]-cysteine S-methyltransferase [Acidimicrobiales bacterium]|jgi:methylated-DNA-[protein]-cysteine S-methyltransferase
MNSPRDITLTTTVDSPVGPLTLTSKAGRLTGLHMDGQAHAPTDRTGWARDAGAFRDITDQLTAYFAGELTEFDVDLDLAGTDFQRSVWGALRQIPYGETWSYSQLAGKIGNSRACRAVGLANGRNPVAIIVPCHRVIGANGSLVGFGGGLDRKALLLEHERKVASLAGFV